MDAATLRILLIVLGALLLTGLYLWERHRAQVRDDEDDWDEEAEQRPRSRREPRFGGYEDDAGQSGAARDAADGPEPAWQATGFDAAEEPGLADAGEDVDPREADALIVQLYLIAADGDFRGPEILAAAERHNLLPGEMSIFHRGKVEGAARSAPFSMANAFNPGTFPFDDMDDFGTRGLVLFAQLDGAPSDLMVFDELVQSARALARELDGDLLDNARQPLGDEQIKRLRAEVLDLLDGIAEPERP